MRTKSLSRRSWLVGSAGVAVGLPFLEGLQSRSAWAQDEDPVFSLYIVTANGVVQRFGSEPEHFWPSQTGPLTTASMEAEAADRATGILSEYADSLLIVSGIDYPFRSTGCGHAQGFCQSLTAAKVNGTDNKAMSSGVSVDTVIAEALNPAGVEPLTLYSGLKAGYINERISFSAPDQVRSAEGNPWNVYQRLTGLVSPGGDSGDENLAGQLAARRQSVNDVVGEELQAILNRPELSQDDRLRLEQHFESLRELENGMVGMALSCTEEGLSLDEMQALDSGDAFRRDGVIEEVAALQLQLAAFAFACNATRVATLQIGDGTDSTRYEVNGQPTERFHWISHRIKSDGNSGESIPEAVEWHTAIDRIRMETFRNGIAEFNKYAVGNGTLLDQSIMMWTNQVATGPAHSFSNLPIIIAGKAGGRLATGQYIDVDGQTNNKLYNTLLTAAGVGGGAPVEDFGSSEVSGGVLSELLA